MFCAYVLSCVVDSISCSVVSVGVVAVSIGLAWLGFQLNLYSNLCVCLVLAPIHMCLAIICDLCILFIYLLI